MIAIVTVLQLACQKSIRKHILRSYYLKSDCNILKPISLKSDDRNEETRSGSKPETHGFPWVSGRKTVGLEVKSGYSRVLKKMAARNPISVAIPVIDPPFSKASGSIVSAIMVSMAPAANPSMTAKSVGGAPIKKILPT